MSSRLPSTLTPEYRPHSGESLAQACARLAAAWEQMEAEGTLAAARDCLDAALAIRALCDRCPDSQEADAALAQVRHAEAMLLRRLKNNQCLVQRDRWHSDQARLAEQEARQARANGDENLAYAWSQVQADHALYALLIPLVRGHGSYRPGRLDRVALRRALERL